MQWHQDLWQFPGYGGQDLILTALLAAGRCEEREVLGLLAQHLIVIPANDNTRGTSGTRTGFPGDSPLSEFFDFLFLVIATPVSEMRLSVNDKARSNRPCVGSAGRKLEIRYELFPRYSAKLMQHFTRVQSCRHFRRTGIQHRLGVRAQAGSIYPEIVAHLKR